MAARTLRVTVSSARDLIAADSGRSSDPFASVVLQNKQGRPISREKKTDVVTKTLTPSWNADFDFEVFVA